MDSNMTNLLALAASSYLPGENSTMKSMLAVTATNTLVSVLKSASGLKPWWDRLYYSFVNKEASVVINGMSDPQTFEDVEKYVMNKYMDFLRHTELGRRRGHIECVVNNAVFSQKLVDYFENKKIVYDLAFSAQSDTNKTIITSIKIGSSELSVKQLKSYIDFIVTSKNEVKLKKVFTVHCDTSTGKDDKKMSSAGWKMVEVQTNRSLSNTILSEENEKELYDDVRKFMKSEQLYNEKGWPWKRGYLLHGPPGTGKTSAIKAIANEFSEIEGIFIFNLVSIADLDNANNLFEQLMADVGLLARNKPYILCFEDADRADSMWPRYEENGRSNTNAQFKVSTFLNEIDGIIESHGRLLFMTANNLQPFQYVENVLFRPGRIDKKIHLGPCDMLQAKRIMSLFYDHNPEILQKLDAFKHVSNMTSAFLTNILQTGLDVDETMQRIFTNEPPSQKVALLDNVSTKKRKRQPPDERTLRRRIKGLKISVKRNTEERVKQRRLRLERSIAATEKQLKRAQDRKAKERAKAKADAKKAQAKYKAEVKAGQAKLRADAKKAKAQAKADAKKAKT